MALLAGLPRTQRLLDSLGRLSDVWDRWWQSIVRQLDNSAYGVGSVSVSGSAAIASTDVPIQTVTDGLYRVTYSQRIVTPGSVSSSVTSTFAWTCNGVSCSTAGAAMTGNTTATQQNGTYVIQVDASTPITYAVAYASTAAGMVYDFDVWVERLP
jgi:hypothetical protein